MHKLETQPNNPYDDEDALSAYASRLVADPRFSVEKFKTVNSSEVLSRWVGLQDREISNSSGEQILYFHVPFCAVRCPFCRFFINFAKDDQTVSQYTNALLKEIEYTTKQVQNVVKPVSTIYFGGGTPSLLPTDDISRVISNIKENFVLRDDCEITLEGRVEDIQEEKVNTYLALGINRFSLGVQSFNTAVRNRMGRPRSREDVIANLDKLTSRGSAAVSIDLIYGLPNQSKDVWTNDIQDLLSTGVDAVDIYQLEDSILRELMGEKLDKYYLADQAERAVMYKHATSVLAANGFVPMNNTHWSRNIRERNRYTTLTRAGKGVFQNNVLAFGSGAQGRVGHVKYQVEKDINKYYEAISAGRKPIEYIEEPVRDAYVEELICQIDSGSVIPSLILDKYGVNILEKFKGLIIELEKSGLIVSSDDFIKLTHAGSFWKSNISLEFINRRKSL
jgi:oxygen-independent coproporphyrinogen-3 oxidase